MSMRRKARVTRRLLLRFAPACLLYGAGRAYIAKADDGAELRKRGQQLRAAMTDAYRHNERYPKEKFNGIDISTVVSEYISLGVSFSDAEFILSSAGFEISRPNLDAPPVPTNRPKDWYAVIARIEDFAHGFFWKTGLYVSLLPPAAGDYSIVTDVHGTFFTVTL
jgi:hypothetical protein